MAGFYHSQAIQKIQAQRQVDAGVSAVGAAALGLIGTGIQAGVNARAASVAWDRQKNWATRSATYSRINLEAAKFNPIYAMTGGNAFLQAGGAKAPQAHSVQNPRLAEAALTGSAMAANQATANKLNAEADLARTKTKDIEYGLPQKSAVADVWESMDPKTRVAAANDIIRNGYRFPRGFMDSTFNFMLEKWSNNQTDVEKAVSEYVQGLIELVKGEPEFAQHTPAELQSMRMEREATQYFLDRAADMGLDWIQRRKLENMIRRMDERIKNYGKKR